MYEIRYTKGGEKDYVKVVRSPYADIASGILEQLKADPYSNSEAGWRRSMTGTSSMSVASAPSIGMCIRLTKMRRRFSFGRCGIIMTGWARRGAKSKKLLQ